MNRRELLKMVAAATGGVVIGGEFFLAGCKNPDAGTGTSSDFSESQVAFLDEVAETIFPKTSTPGAKDAKVGQYMTVMVKDTYEEKDQLAFQEGMKKIDEACNKMHGHDFMKATPEHRKEVLVALDKEKTPIIFSSISNSLPSWATSLPKKEEKVPPTTNPFPENTRAMFLTKRETKC
jgi:hypothetical protein